jgi:hypothetical protein
MKKFLAIYTGSATSTNRARWDRLDEAERKRRTAQGVKAWQEWMSAHRSAVLDGGGPLGRTRQVSTAGIADIRNAMAAYVMVQAESHEAAARLFENHPHFSIFPGDAVEIMEVLPVPVR